MAKKWLIWGKFLGLCVRVWFVEGEVYVGVLRDCF